MQLIYRSRYFNYMLKHTFMNRLYILLFLLLTTASCKKEDSPLVRSKAKIKGKWDWVSRYTKVVNPETGKQVSGDSIPQHIPGYSEFTETEVKDYYDKREQPFFISNYELTDENHIKLKYMVRAYGQEYEKESVFEIKVLTDQTLILYSDSQILSGYAIDNNPVPYNVVVTEIVYSKKR